MNILAIDQARSGAWCVFDYDTKKPVAYDSFSFPADKYTFEKAVAEICDIVQELMVEYDISAVFFEDVQLRQSADTFKKLAQLQGSLIYLFEKNEYLYDLVPPTRWQSYCNARSRTSKEIKSKQKEAIASGKKQSKVLSIQFVNEQFGVETDDDNLADAMCIGYYAVNNVTIRSCE